MEYCVELNGGMYTLPPYTNKVRSKINRLSTDDLNEKADDFKNAGNIQELDKMLKKQENKQRNVMRRAF